MFCDIIDINIFAVIFKYFYCDIAIGSNIDFEKITYTDDNMMRFLGHRCCFFSKLRNAKILDFSRVLDYKVYNFSIIYNYNHIYNFKYVAFLQIKSTWVLQCLLSQLKRIRQAKTFVRSTNTNTK